MYIFKRYNNALKRSIYDDFRINFFCVKFIYFIIRLRALQYRCLFATRWMQTQHGWYCYRVAIVKKAHRTSLRNVKTNFCGLHRQDRFRTRVCILIKHFLLLSASTISLQGLKSCFYRPVYVRRKLIFFSNLNILRAGQKDLHYLCR